MATPPTLYLHSRGFAVANNINDPQWRKLIPADIQARIQSVRGIKDGDRNDSRWVIYCDLDNGERFSGVYDPSTNGFGYTISSSVEACESDLRRKRVAARVGLSQKTKTTKTARARVTR